MIKIELNQRQSLWYKRYCEEVKRMTDYYTYLNSQSETITRKITPDEEEQFNALLNKTDCHRLTIKKG